MKRRVIAWVLAIIMAFPVNVFSAETEDMLLLPGVEEGYWDEDFFLADEESAYSDDVPEEDYYVQDSPEDEAVPDLVEIQTQTEAFETGMETEDTVDKTKVFSAVVGEQTVSFDSGETDPEELFKKYVDKEIKGLKQEKKTSGTGRPKRYAASRLTGINAVVYNVLKPMIVEVAEGNRASTSFVVTLEDIGLAGSAWTAQDLGVESLIDGESISADAVTAVSANLYQIKRVTDNLLIDLPFDLYWFDKTQGVQDSGFSIMAYYDDDREDYVLAFEGNTTISFAVSQEYAVSEFEVDTQIGSSVNTAKEKVNEIVQQYASADDYDKLLGYKNEICNLVSYNYEAYEGNVAYGNPWQLIWVFDEDPSTNVVCEGYSKGFQYLCDLTQFTNDIRCITVTGTMSGGTGEGPHMWNIVRMEDGNNYLVDVTNCDEGCVGQENELFLIGCSDRESNAEYRVISNGSEVIYTYDSVTLSAFAEEELVLSELSYLQNKQPMETYEENGIVYLISNEKATVAGHTVIGTEIQIPDSVNGFPVVEVSDYAFFDCQALETVSLPDSVIRIGDEAFSQCYKLKSINIPLNLETLGEWAFFECYELAGPIEIPASTYYIKSKAFPLCRELKAINVSEENRYYSSVDGVLFNKDKTVLLECPAGKQGEFQIPESVVEIKNKAFYYCEKLEGCLTIPEGVTEIQESTFSGCSQLNHIYLNEGLESIGEYAFLHCRNLSAIELPISIRTIGRGTFSCCSSLKTIDLSKFEWDSIPEDLLNGCEQLKTVLLPETITRIEAWAFSGCKNLQYDIQDIMTDKIEYLGSSAFTRCESLTGTIIIPDGRDKIYYAEFLDCASLEGVIIPDSVEEIEDRAFSGCTNLSDITFGNNVTKIGQDAFKGTAWLNNRDNVTVINGILVDFQTDTDEFEIPADVIALSGQVFSKWNYIRRILVSPENSSFMSIDGVLFDSEGKELVAYPGRSDEFYQVPEGVEKIGSRAFEKNDCLHAVLLPESLLEIGDSAFAQCRQLENIIIPDNVRTIGEQVFYMCPKLRSAVLGNGIKRISRYTFAWCQDLQDLLLPEFLEYVEEYAFYACSSLKTVELPETFSGIEQRAFDECPNMIVRFMGDAPVFYSRGLFVENLFELSPALWIPDAASPFGEPTTVLYVKPNSNGFYNSLWEYYQISSEEHEHEEEILEQVVPSCSVNGLTEGVRCKTCGKVIVPQYIIPPVEHTIDITEMIAPTCTGVGYTEGISCSVCGKTLVEQEEIPATGHTWSDKYTVDKAATCTEEGSKSIHCTRCNEVKDTEVIPATGHIYGDWEVKKAATCTETGIKERICGCGEKEAEIIPAAGHKVVKDAAVAVTCTQNGLTEGSHCSSCGEVFIAQEEIPATGHSWNKDYTLDQPATCQVEGNQSIHCSVCDIVKEDSSKIISKADHEYGEWSIVKEATTEVAGLKERVCSVCGNKDTAEIPKKETSVTEPTATPMPTPKPDQYRFSDVLTPTHPYYKAIYWAADAGITKGYSDGTFGINRSCTRGEMMMFLWRYAGKPAPKNVSKSPFKDVPKTHTFYKAILWGSQKGITKGYSDGTFGINRNVSRGECMMFLWRLKGKPAPKAVAKAPFPDVPKSHVFYNAVLWGYQKKITTGFTSGKLKGKFGVNENCSRGQIVTFLYRAK